jgi:Putative Flp pilus-assembly TadE/G-like/Putative Tad-like Flp pilus-assembly
MVLVAIAMVAIIAMAALSIDVITLYLAREEAQRAADAGALAAARVISISGVTGTAGPDSDSGAWSTICGGNTSVASLTAKAAAQENSVAGNAATVTVTYSSGSGPDLPLANCTAVTLDDQLGVNPLVTVKVERDSLPTLFSRIWSRATNTVSATATAEAFNPSNSGSFAPGGDAVPVTPRCVKPWIIPNKEDPKNGGRLFVDKRTGEIQTLGVRVNGAGTGIVGESFTLTDSCSRSDCSNMVGQVPAPGAYIPALVTQPAIAVPSCADDSDYQKAIGGCDQSTVYACGTVGGSTADLTINPGGATGDTSLAAQCLIHQSGGLGQDTLDVAAFPFQIKAGSANPIISSTTQVITASNSIVTLPIYDDSVGRLPSSKPTITVIGFLQVFIDSVTANGNLNVHVLNVAGCGNDASTTLSAPGTSPVPIRLITRQ